jgi:hypothetical protein
LGKKKHPEEERGEFFTGAAYYMLNPTPGTRQHPRRMRFELTAFSQQRNSAIFFE